MTTTLWDTTGSAVVQALQAERRQSGAVSLGLALSLVVVTDERDLAAAEKAVSTASSEHPARVLLVIRRSFQTDDRLDAEVSVGDRFGPGEAVVLRMYGRLSLHAESVVLPLLAPDTPVVTWLHGIVPETLAHDPLAVLASRRITDCSLADEPLAALTRRAEDYAPGDTDLAWTRATPWRALMATAFDTKRPTVVRGVVRSEAGNATADLIAGWLQARLDVPVETATGDGPGITGVHLELADGAGTLEVERQDGTNAVLRRPDQPARQLPLTRRDLGDLLAEELRRLDPDEPYAEALAAARGLSGLSDRPPVRRHEWRDPAEEARAKEERPADEARAEGDA